MTDFKGHWAPDSASNYCTKCKLEFTNVRRRHHCRLCGLLFCDDCSNRRIDIRVCNIRGGRGCARCHIFLTRHIPLLKRESSFSRYEDAGRASSVKVCIVNDLTELSYRYQNDSYPSKLPMSSFMRYVDGCDKKCGNWKAGSLFSCCGGGDNVDYMLCFNLFFSSETLSLASTTLGAKSDWCEAFNEFLEQRKTPGGRALIALLEAKFQKEKAAEKRQTQQKRQRVLNKYSKLRNDMRNKYS
mmetsp:Transcript_22930/g.25505  ORF Transcript_22930/g.25505 Transcript_22930/m.25505 type:complete len:242 (-) Transcript_22930:129-854(-)